MVNQFIYYFKCVANFNFDNSDVHDDIIQHKEVASLAFDFCIS